MVCKKPFTRGVEAYGCGQCLPCRVNRRRIWTHRVLLEAIKSSESSFITLTYDDENLPENGSLCPSHVRDWLKRIRKKVEPRKLRYFLVGEYGDETKRPHYHVALFGVGVSVS